jgi:hypothetical protein
VVLYKEHKDQYDAKVREHVQQVGTPVAHINASKILIFFSRIPLRFLRSQIAGLIFVDAIASTPCAINSLL